MIEATEAAERIIHTLRPLGTERVPLLECVGRVAAEPIVTEIAMPPWDNSSMDGYAVRAADAAVGAKLRVVETIMAGGFPSRAIEAGEAMKIMTGAPVPNGADTVIRVEDTDRQDGVVRIVDARDAGRNVRPRGEDFQAGTVIVKAGEELHAAHVGTLASAGVQQIVVHRRPRVAFLTSGDELVPLEQFDEVKAGRRIVSSNSYTLQVLIRAAGGIPVDVGIAADTPESLRERLTAAADVDLIVTSAGISVGDQDYTRTVLQELGMELQFWKVRIRPGAPMAFGIIRGIPWIGLSGNPVSATVTFELFVRPAIRRLLGHQNLFLPAIPVTLAERVTIHANLTHFLRAIVTFNDGRYMAQLAGNQSSAATTTLARANALLVVPAHRDVCEAGTTLRAILLTDPSVPKFAIE